MLAIFIRATFSDRPVNSARVYAGDFTRATFSDRLVNSARVYAGDFIRATFSDRLAKLSQGRCWRLPQHRVQRESALLTEWMTGPWKCHPGSGTKVRIWTHNCPVIIIIRRRRRIRKSDKLLFSEPERELLFDGGSGGHGTDVYYLLQTAFWRGSVKYAYVQFCVKCFELSQWCYSCCAIEVLYYIRSFNFFKITFIEQKHAFAYVKKNVNVLNCLLLLFLTFFWFFISICTFKNDGFSAQAVCWWKLASVYILSLIHIWRCRRWP